MVNFIDRFKKRDAVPLEIEVPVPIDNGVFRLKVKRFAQEEINAAVRLAEKDARERGVDVDSAPKGYAFGMRGLHLTKFIQRHISGWEHEPSDGSEPLAYDHKLIDGLFAQMDESELASIGMTYMVMLDMAYKKKENSANLETETSTLSNPIEAQSSSESETP